MVPRTCVNTWFLETFPGPPRGHSNTGAPPAELPDFGLHLPEDMGATHLLGIGADAADKERLCLPQCLQELVKGRLGKEGEILSWNPQRQAAQWEGTQVTRWHQH